MGISIPDSLKNRVDFSKIDVAELKKAGIEKCQKSIGLLRQSDKKALALSLSVVAGVYVLMFLYVYINTATTIQTLEDSMASETEEITEGVAFGHSQTNNKYYAGADLEDGLSQFEDVGRLPIIRAKDQLTSFRAYQTNFDFGNKSQKYVTSFMVRDFGLSEKSSQMALDILPPEISFLLSPYAALPLEWVKLARAKGHEVWLDVPVQSHKYPDSGLRTMFHHQNLNEKIESLHGSLARALGYVGVGMYLDETMMPVEEHYKKISDELYGRGLGVFEKNPDAPRFIEKSALMRGSPFIRADLDVFQMKGDHSFSALEDIAKKQGYAVAVIPSYPEALKNLSVWLEKVGVIDYTITPVSAIYDLPSRGYVQEQNGHNNAPSGLSLSDQVAHPVEKLNKTHAH